MGTIQMLAFAAIVLRWVWLDASVSLDDMFSGIRINPESMNGRNNITNDFEIVTTNYGWNTEELTGTKKFSRRILTGEFFESILSHERYNASAWADLEKNPDPTRRVVAFLDVDTCLELNWPNYGAGKDWQKNLEAGRATDRYYNSIVLDSCKYLKRAATSPALMANPLSRLVVLDCAGYSGLNLRSVCNNDEIVFGNEQIIFAYTSVAKNEVRPSDVGLPPPALKSISLPAYERYQVQACDKRKYLFSFQGKRRSGRSQLLKFADYEDMHIRFRELGQYASEIQGDSTTFVDSNGYREVMQQSVFAGAPRGDSLFSYRFAEILSAGAIPVVYADGWLPPFNDNVVDWTKCAIFIPESDYHQTREVLLAVSDEKRCQMQQCALEVWDKYMSTRAGWVRGLVEVALQL